MPDTKNGYTVTVLVSENTPTTMPPTPLRANAPTFEPQPVVAPGAITTFTSQNMIIQTTAAGIEVLGNYLSALAKDFVPGAAVSSDVSITNPPTNEITGSETSVSEVKSSPAPTETSVESTPVTWNDMDELQRLLGDTVTKSLVTTFDPSAPRLYPSKTVKTAPMLDGFMRKQVHALVDRIYGTRLAHGTYKKSKQMWFNEPSSRDFKHNARAFNHNPNANGGVVTKNQPTAYSSRAPPNNERPDWKAVREDMQVQYHASAAESNLKYAEWKAANEKAWADRQAELKARPPTTTTTFLPRGVKVETEVIEKPKTKILPPHLRKKSHSTETGAWVAAKLPTPCMMEV